MKKIKSLLKDTNIDISDLEEILELLNEVFIKLKCSDAKIKKLE